MKIVIDIDIDLYTRLFDNGVDDTNVRSAVVAIRKGTPLPEHLGRLIDADAVIEEATKGMKYPKNHTYMECVIAHINLAPTIIEGSDKE